jgi:hypothetical protein
MKMVKSLLLGSAAGLIAVTGAQAADLPVKAKAAEYVKICSLYGVGYYYIPGTDTCIKIGGYVRYEAYHNDTTGNYADRNLTGRFTRNSTTFAQQARFRLTTDVRTQTEYGTLRSYVSFGLNFLNSADDTALPAGVGAFGFALERAFIQFAGFTFGRTDTFFGFYNGAAYGLVPVGLDGSSGPLGHNVAAYTWQFGNGLSATIAIEDAAHRVKPVTDLNDFFIGTTSDASGQKVPDIVGNIRVDQAWGSAQIMGALHQVSARYYSDATPGASCTVANSTVCAYPGDEWGWAVGGGLTLKMPWDAKDTLSGVIAYGKGATGFVAYGNSPTNFIHKQGVAVGASSDAVFGVVGGVGSELELTEAWGGTVAFEHYWTPSLRTSAVFGYLDVSYTDNAKNLIAATTCGGGGVTVPAGASCNPDFSMWRVASRTMWNPVQNLDIGVEVAYSKINTAFAGANVVGTTFGLAGGTYSVEDQGYWSAAFRVQRNFWP